MCAMAVFNRTSDKKIEWAKWTWNPYHGCLGPDGNGVCEYCYARDIAEDLYPEKFEPKFEPHRLNAPENTKVPVAAMTDIGERNVFVCSMGDLFGDWVPQEWIDQITEKGRWNPQWNFLYLTKNPRRLIDIDWPSNAWVGTTVEVQSRVETAEDAFRKIAASVKFLSCEPLSEHVVFDDLSMFDWLIIGCRSKTKRLPAMQPDWEWVESLIEQGRKADLKIYMKPELRIPPDYIRIKEYPDLEAA